MTRRNICCHYDVYCPVPTGARPAGPEGLLDRARSVGVRYDRVERTRHPGCFQPPRLGTAGTSDPFRQPSPAHAAALVDAVGRAVVCWTIECQTTHADLSPLQAAMGLAGYCAAQHGGEFAVVVDRTTDIGYDGHRFFLEQHMLGDSGELDVRDHILIEETPAGSRADVRTRGMEKFGQSNFVFAGFPTDHLAMLRWFLNERLCRHAGLQAPVVAGQSFCYAPADRFGALYFSLGPQALLYASDCHVEDRRRVTGFDHFLRILSPVIDAWTAAAAARAPRGSSRRVRAVRPLPG